VEHGDIRTHRFRNDRDFALAERIRRENHVIAPLEQIGADETDHRHVRYTHRPSLGL
jgi:hypothetical protein